MKYHPKFHNSCNTIKNFTIFEIMKKKWNYILMADIIGSRKVEQSKLMKGFKNVVANANKNLEQQLLSPLTITLGDEFQSVAKSLSSALDTVLYLEELIIKSKEDFKLRYVLLEGAIETPINSQIAYGMLGSGLTEARETLVRSKKQKTRFNITLNDQELEKALTDAFLVLQRIIDKWKVEKDYYIVAEFLANKDYKRVAADLEKERSLIWKREKSLGIEEYFALKDVIHYLASK